MKRGRKEGKRRNGVSGSEAPIVSGGNARFLANVRWPSEKCGKGKNVTFKGKGPPEGKDGKTLFVEEEADNSGNLDEPAAPTNTNHTSDHVSVPNGVDYDTPAFWNCEDGDLNVNGWYSAYICVCIINYESTMNEGGIVIDSGATATVCGRSWLGKLVSIPVELPKGPRTFRFGDGRRFASEGFPTLTFQS